MPRRTAPVLLRIRPLLTLTAVTSATAGLLALLGAPEASAAGRAAVPAAAPGEAAATVSPAEQRPADKLTFTVTRSGRAARDGSYTLRCRPAGGGHPTPGRACAALDRVASGGSDPFAPVPGDAVCTMIYGGPAQARVTGTWHGRKVDARFRRTNGCEVARWNRLVPALPRTSF
ncbi:SSI family serine proteinase inhibitor [Streptomyces sp. NPDC006925]|uniref:SSI family serine proteinase inhibitor n=1 Tax=Streptomyces sp. NPDC006925 TaxID=3364768 RepID=UPI0036C5FD92